MKIASVQRFVLLAAILIASVASAYAQSGRRSPPKSPVPAAPSEPETKVPATKTEPAPELQLLVGIQQTGAFDGVPYYVDGTVISVCVGRLNQAAGVRATVTGDRMTRSDAIKLAKGESERYVIWLEVRSEAMDASRGSNTSRSDLYVNYVIFEPRTGKAKASGSAHHGVRSSGPVGIGLPPTSGGATYSDYAIKEVAREAADKILSAFEIKADGRPR